MLAAFQRRYPDIQIHVYSTERRVDLVEDGIDVALRVGAIVHEAMVARRVLSYRNVLVASPRLVERFGVPVHPDALHRLPCAVWASRIDVPARWELGGHIVEPKAVLSTNDYHHLCNRALRGDGNGAAALSGGCGYPGEPLGAVTAAIPLARMDPQPALSAAPSPINYRQNVS
jgi:DNA-binding transcriptional LysR family regulator